MTSAPIQEPIYPQDKDKKKMKASWASWFVSVSDVVLGKVLSLVNASKLGGYSSSSYQRTGAFISSPQTISSAGVLSLAHSLTQPDGTAITDVTKIQTQTYLKCLVGEGGYSVGDIVSVPVFHTVWNGATNVSRGCSLVPTITNIDITYCNYGAGSPWNIVNKSNGAIVSITDTSWALIVVARYMP